MPWYMLCLSQVYSLAKLSRLAQLSLEAGPSLLSHAIPLPLLLPSVSVLFVFCGTGVWIQVKPLPWATPAALFCDGFFQDRVLRTTFQGWLWTTILLISASWVARITGVNQAPSFYFSSDHRATTWLKACLPHQITNSLAVIQPSLLYYIRKKGDFSYSTFSITVAPFLTLPTATLHFRAAFIAECRQSSQCWH
jgi:hypothetical protein